jgi:hypothetical protein
MARRNVGRFDPFGAVKKAGGDKGDIFNPRPQFNSRMTQNPPNQGDYMSPQDPNNMWDNPTPQGNSGGAPSGGGTVNPIQPDPNPVPWPNRNTRPQVNPGASYNTNPNTGGQNPWQTTPGSEWGGYGGSGWGGGMDTDPGQLSWDTNYGAPLNPANPQNPGGGGTVNPWSQGGTWGNEWEGQGMWGDQYNQTGGVGMQDDFAGQGSGSPWQNWSNSIGGLGSGQDTDPGQWNWNTDHYNVSAVNRPNNMNPRPGGNTGRMPSPFPPVIDDQRRPKPGPATSNQGLWDNLCPQGGVWNPNSGQCESGPGKKA